MKRAFTILAVFALSCSAPDGTTDQPDMAGPDTPTSPHDPVELFDWYDGTAELADGSSVEIEIRFVTLGDERALLRVGELSEGWGYGASFQTDGSQVLVETGPPRCASDCPRGTLVLEGRADGDVLEFTSVSSDVGDAPFVALRAVPHDGVKPVLNPVVDFTYDPAPVAGVYPGIIYALADLGAVNRSCTLELDAEPLRAAAFDCGVLSGIDDGALIWDAERQLLNVLVGPDDGRLLLVAALSAEHDGMLVGVLADMPLGDAVIAPEDVAHDDLVGLVELAEDGIR